jgi:sterol desaturase/sphingolipid hydroxylase (fatty acid hydroxylase superfamily)
MVTTLELVVLLVIATIGHVMAFIWFLAGRYKWKISERTIYDLPINDKQMRREFKNSLHTPSHAVILFGFLYLGFFQNTSIASFFISAFATFIWAEIWHYGSHRAFHLSALHWIHAEHHKSHLNSPFTAISFSFTEKLIFDLGILGLLAAVDLVYSLNFYGIAAWFIGYLLVNSFSHANFELKSKDYNRWVGKVLTSTTYHSLHHSRYTGNYGLGTRVLDRIFRTEWEDYERLYDRVSREERPLSRLRERVPLEGARPAHHT